MAVERCSFLASFARARSAAWRVLNGFESGVNSPPTYLKSSHWHEFRTGDFISFL